MSGWPRRLAGAVAPNEAKASASVVASDQPVTITVSQSGCVAAVGRDAVATPMAVSGALGTPLTADA